VKQDVLGMSATRPSGTVDWANQIYNAALSRRLH